MNLDQLHDLARLLSAAFRGSPVDSACVSALHQLCPSISLVSVTVLASNSMLISAGNMACLGRCSVTLVPLGKAAALSCLRKHQCLQLDLQQLERPSPYYDCEEAMAMYHCRALAFAPIPCGTAGGHMVVGTETLRGMGVLTIGTGSCGPIELGVVCKMLTLCHLLTKYLARDSQYVMKYVQDLLVRAQCLSRHNQDDKDTDDCACLEDEDSSSD